MGIENMKDESCNCYTCANSEITDGAQIRCLMKRKIVPYDGWCEEFHDYMSDFEEIREISENP